jgi:hypothetical protein
VGDLEKMLGGWEFMFLDSRGIYRGVVFCWKNKYFFGSNFWYFDS